MLNLSRDPPPINQPNNIQNINNKIKNQQFPQFGYFQIPSNLYMYANSNPQQFNVQQTQFPQVFPPECYYNQNTMNGVSPPPPLSSEEFLFQNTFGF